MPSIYNPSTQGRIADEVLGLRVDRAAAVAANGTNAIYNVVGRIVLTYLIGEQVTANDGTGATLQISCLTTDATAVATPLSVASATTANKTASILYTLPAAVSSGVTISTGTSAALINVDPLYAVATGAINLIVGTGPTTGTIKWSLWYIPIDDGAYVTAA